MAKGLTAEEMQKDDEHMREYEEEQTEQDQETMDIGMKEVHPGAEEVAQGIRQLEISEGMDVDDGPQEGAPLSPAASEKSEK